MNLEALDKMAGLNGAGRVTVNYGSVKIEGASNDVSVVINNLMNNERLLINKEKNNNGK